MYFENGCISPRQMTRLIITEFLGITLLTSSGITSSMCGRDGILSIVYATVSAAVYVWLVLVLCEKTGGSVLEYMEAHLGRKVSCTAAVIFGIKYLMFAAGCLLMVGTVVQRVLLQQYHPAIIIIPMALLIIYGLSLDWESRARFAEVACYFVVIPAVIVILITWGKCDRYNISPIFMGKQGRVIMTGIWYMVLSSPGEMLLFSRQHFEPDSKMKKAVLKGIFTVGVFNIIFYILNIGIYGIDSASDSLVSSIRLMQSVGHLESIISLFLIISLYTLVNCYGSYSLKMIRHLTKGKKRKINSRFNRAGYMCTVGIVIAVISCTAASYGVLADSSRDVSANVTMEERDYVMFMGIDYEAGNYKVTYGYDSDRESVEWSGKSLLQAKEAYGYISPGTVDFSHIKSIVLGENVLSSKNALEGLRRFLETEETIADDTIVIATEGKAGKYDEIMGSNIKYMFENNLYYLKCEANEIVRAVSDRHKAVTLGLVTENDKSPECTGMVIIDGRGTKKILDINDSKLLMLAGKDISGHIVKISDGKMYKVNQNASDIKINIINNETIGVEISLTGYLTNISGYNVDADSANEKIEREVFNMLTDLMGNSGIDYLNVYDRLSVADRGMWVKFASDREAMYKRVYFDVNAHYDIR